MQRLTWGDAFTEIVTQPERSLMELRNTIRGLRQLSGSRRRPGRLCTVPVQSGPVPVWCTVPV
jgi:hypothetical protein